MSLREKGIIDENDGLTKCGMIVLDAISDYKEADKYVILNRLHVALRKNRNSIVIFVSESGQVVLFRIQKEYILQQLFKEYPYLQEDEHEIVLIEQKLHLTELLDKLSQDDGKILSVGVFCSKARQEEVIYSFHTQTCIMYDLITGISKEVTPCQVRESLCAIMEIG